MRLPNFHAFASSALLLVLCLCTTSQAADSHQEKSRKCIPSRPCWPSPSLWSNLNASINGQLIKNLPAAAPCYPPNNPDSPACQDVAAHWNDTLFEQAQPVGYSYPLNVSCLYPVQGTCDLGQAPVYTVNATEVRHVQEGVRFAREKNLRLVVRSTGHDINGR